MKTADFPMIDGFNTGDGSKWGLWDWYENKEQLLRAAIESRKPFDTGWYSSKKEIASARIMGDGKTLYIETSVSDDFDTPGSGRGELPYSKTTDATISALQKHLGELHDEASEDLKANAVYTGFSIHNKKGRWIETYIRNDSDYPYDSPPGDNYHQWGFQDEFKLPNPVRNRLEHWALKWTRENRTQRFTVAGYTITPWRD